MFLLPWAETLSDTQNLYMKIATTAGSEIRLQRIYNWAQSSIKSHELLTSPRFPIIFQDSNHKRSHANGSGYSVRAWRTTIIRLDVVGGYSVWEPPNNRVPQQQFEIIFSRNHRVIIYNDTLSDAGTL